MLRRGFLGSLAAFLGLGAGSASVVSGASIEPIAARIESRKRFICVELIPEKYRERNGSRLAYIDLNSICYAARGMHIESGLPFWFVGLSGNKLEFPVEGNEHFTAAVQQETLS